MPQPTALAGSITSQEGNQNQSAGDSGKKMFSQEELNGFLAKERREVEAKYADYDKYKQAYDQLHEIEESKKTELQKALDARLEAEAELSRLKAEKEQAEWIKAASKETGVPEAALHGSTEEEIKACAELLREYFAKPAAPVVNTGKPTSETTDSDGDPLRNVILGN